MGSLGYYLGEARKRPLAFLLQRARDAAFHAVRGGVAGLGGRPYSSRLPRDEVLALGLFLDSDALDSSLDFVQERNPGELDHLFQRADAALRGEFTIYSRVARVDDMFDWHRDHYSGYSWPIRFHTRYRYADLIDLERPSDVKVPWELSRLQFLPSLALAYRLTNRKEYCQALQDFIEEWDRANSVGYGVTWKVGMEVALRAISLILAAEFLNETPAAKQVVTPRLTQLLAEHGRFLYRNIEYSDVNGNHYTSCLLGLLYLGLYLPGEKEAQAWRGTALAGLRKEMLEQTYPDGVSHEGSIPYHRLVLEIFVHAAVLCRRNRLDLGDEYSSRLEKMIEFVAGYLKPSGEAPVWGDADDGRVHAIGGQSINDHRYLLTLGAALFKRPDFLAKSGPVVLDAVVLLDQELRKNLVALEGEAPETLEPRSVAFPDGGVFILRRAGSYAIIDCGDVGYRGRGGHGHNDALSVEIALEGYDVVTDTGCPSYTRSAVEREAAISARAHNVAVVDNNEPAPIAREDGVRIPHATRCPVDLVTWNPEAYVFRGRHFGYQSLEEPVVYERELRLDPCRSNITINDYLDGTGIRTVAWYFHLAERWKNVSLVGYGAALLTDEWEAQVRIRCGLPEAVFSLERSSYYPSYDCRRERWCLVATIEAELPVRASFELAWVG